MNTKTCHAIPGDSAADLDRVVNQALPVRELLAEAINQWPEYDTEDEEVDGCDLVTWFAAWRERAKAVLS